MRRLEPCVCLHQTNSYHPASCDQSCITARAFLGHVPVRSMCLGFFQPCQPNAAAKNKAILKAILWLESIRSISSGLTSPAGQAQLCGARPYCAGFVKLVLCLRYLTRLVAHTQPRGARPLWRTSGEGCWKAVAGRQ